MEGVGNPEGREGAVEGSQGFRVENEQITLLLLPVEAQSHQHAVVLRLRRRVRHEVGLAGGWSVVGGGWWVVGGGWSPVGGWWFVVDVLDDEYELD